MLAKVTEPWWKSSTVYQIYPLSFLDTTGDGFGDLNGITSKLDYLKDLGVDVVWLSPIYKSPLADMGYDIADYRAIDPRYGTFEDWESLLKGVHERQMKLMMDLVVNHTSEEHDWFVQSRRSKDDPKRAWYIWRPARYDSNGKRHLPNNWRSVFQGSAWTYDEDTDEYYLHIFLEEQPDLNWDNPAVRDAIWDVMRFWLDRDCDGFRIDVIDILSKADGLPDAPIVEKDEEFQPASKFYANGPRVHDYVKKMRENVLSHYDLITVGEITFTHAMEDIVHYVLPKHNEVNMVFQFELMHIDQTEHDDDSYWKYQSWKLATLRDIVSRWQVFKREEGFWNALFIENHDHARSVSRFGNDSTDELRIISAKLIAMMQITQKGTLYIYQGQELGMKNFPRSWGPEEYKDIAVRNYWTRVLAQRMRVQNKKAKEVDMQDIFDDLQKKARDHARTPMQWDASPHGGFTSGNTPWMRVNDDYTSWNAARQLNDEESVLAFWKRALVVRKQYPLLILGEFEVILPDHEQVLAYMRTNGDSRALVLLNFSDRVAKVEIDELDNKWQLMLGNYTVEEGAAYDHLRPYEARLYISL